MIFLCCFYFCQTACFVIAVFLHYLFLVAFCWMATEGVILYLMLVKVFPTASEGPKKKMLFICSWGEFLVLLESSAPGYEYDDEYEMTVIHRGRGAAHFGTEISCVLVDFCPRRFFVGERDKNRKAECSHLSNYIHKVEISDEVEVHKLWRWIDENLLTIINFSICCARISTS